MNKLKVLIADDESLAHKVLEGYCEKLDYLSVVGNCYDGISVLNFLYENEVDILLLDIQMPDLTGLEILDGLQDNIPKVIFTTAFTEFALKGFDYDQVVDYLHKPIRIARFVKAIDRLRKLLILEKDFLKNEALTKVESEILPNKNFISLKDNKTVYRIPFEDILYIQSWGNYLKFFLKNKDVKLIRKTIKSVEEELTPHSFLQIHKSYIVNLKHVKAIEGNVVQLSDHELPVGKSYLILTKRTITEV